MAHQSPGMFCLSIHLWRDTWVISTFWQFWIMLQQRWMYKCLFESLLLIPLGITLGVELLDHVILGFFRSHQFVFLENEIETHSSILAWKIPQTEEPGGLYSSWDRRVGHTCWLSTHTRNLFSSSKRRKTCEYCHSGARLLCRPV